MHKHLVQMGFSFMKEKLRQKKGNRKAKNKTNKNKEVEKICNSEK